jgi:glycosyl transferase, family 25
MEKRPSLDGLELVGVPVPNVIFLCINLDRSPERRAAMEAEAGRVSIALEFVQAIDGKELRLDTVPGYDRAGRLRRAPDLKQAEVACVLSHKKALKRFLTTDAKAAIILEDDAILSDKLAGFATAAGSLPFAWDAINLENRNRKPIPSALAKFDSGIGLYASAWLSRGSAGWMYSRRGAKHVLDSLENFRHAYDTHMGFFWRYGIVALCTDPPLVHQGGTASVIGGGRAFSERDLTIGQFLRARKERIEHELRKQISAYMNIVRVKFG